MRTDFADFPPPSPPARSGGGASDIDRRARDGRETGERDQRFTLPQEARGDTRPGRDSGPQRSSAQGSEAGERGAGRADAQARKADDSQAGKATDAQARKATDAKEASGKASPDKPSREGDAAGNKLSDAAPDAGASDNDRPAGAKLRAMGAVSLIALMRTGSAESKGEALDTGPAEGLVADPENAAEADSGALLQSAPEEIPGEQTGEDDDPRVAGNELPVDVDADPILAEGEAEQAQDDAADHVAGDDDTAEETDADADADAATQAATASAQNAATRNADPARGALPAQASDAARAALARAPGLAGRTAGAEGAAVASGDQAADAQPGEDADGEGASTALETGAGERRGAAERLAGVDQEAARRGAAEAGGNPSAPPRQAGSADEAMKAFEAFKPGATTASGDNAGQQPTQPALDAAKAAAGAQPAQTNGAVLVNTPLSAVPLALGMKAMAGASRFEIRLDPAELGRIDVRLDIDKEGNVKARLTVDRVETLHLLQRDARTLERAFEQAGLKPSEEGIDLSLRDDRGGESRRETRDGDDETGPQPRGAGIEEAGRSEAEIRALARETLLVRQAMRQALGGVDLSI